MPHNGQSPAFGMGQHTLGQTRQERVGSDRGPLCKCLIREIVQTRRARAVAGEVEGDEPQQLRVVAHVVGREVEIRRYRLEPPRFAAGPASGGWWNISATCSPAGVKRWLPSEADRAWEAGNGVVHVPPLNALARYHTAAAAVAVGGVEVAVAAAVGDRVSSYSDFRR